MTRKPSKVRQLKERVGKAFGLNRHRMEDCLANRSICESIHTLYELNPCKASASLNVSLAGRSSGTCESLYSRSELDASSRYGHESRADEHHLAEHDYSLQYLELPSPEASVELAFESSSQPEKLARGGVDPLGPRYPEASSSSMGTSFAESSVFDPPFSTSGDEPKISWTSDDTSLYLVKSSSGISELEGSIPVELFDLGTSSDQRPYLTVETGRLDASNLNIPSSQLGTSILTGQPTQFLESPDEFLPPDINEKAESKTSNAKKSSGYCCKCHDLPCLPPLAQSLPLGFGAGSKSHSLLMPSESLSRLGRIFEQSVDRYLDVVEKSAVPYVSLQPVWAFRPTLRSALMALKDVLNGHIVLDGQQILSVFILASIVIELLAEDSEKSTCLEAFFLGCLTWIEAIDVNDIKTALNLFVAIAWKPKPFDEFCPHGHRWVCALQSYCPTSASAFSTVKEAAFSKSAAIVHLLKDSVPMRLCIQYFRGELSSLRKGVY